MKVKWIEPSVVGSIVVLFVLGTLLVNQPDPVFAEEIQIESELQTIQNSIDALNEKSYHAKYLGNDLLQIKKIGQAIDERLDDEKDSKIQAKLINLSDKYNRAALALIERISIEQKNNDVSLVSKQLVAKTKIFVINIDLVTNKKLEKIVNENFVKNELKRLNLEDEFQKVHYKISIEDTKYGDARDPLIDTIIQFAEAEEYELVDIGFKKLIKKTENYDDGTIRNSIDKTLKLIYELKAKQYQNVKYTDQDVFDLDSAELTLVKEIQKQVDKSVNDVVKQVDEVKMKVENEKSEAAKSANDKKSNGKSNGKSNDKSNDKSNGKNK